jgi:hypothetical protein
VRGVRLLARGKPMTPRFIVPRDIAEALLGDPDTNSREDLGYNITPVRPPRPRGKRPGPASGKHRGKGA